MKINGDYDTANDVSYITLSPNLSHLTSKIELTNNCKADFLIQNSLANLLRFDKVSIDKVYNESSNPINIINVNSILVHCDLVQSSYLNGNPSNTIYSSFLSIHLLNLE